MIGPRQQRPTPVEERAAYRIVTERDGNLCQRCLGWCGASQRDHRKNRSQGGLTLASNLHVLGAICHQWKSEHPREAVRDGWAVPGHANPSEWPARRWFPTDVGTVRVGWCLYDDAGGVREISADEARRRMEGGGWR